jgi:hypothetical protein
MAVTRDRCNRISHQREPHCRHKGHRIQAISRSHRHVASTQQRASMERRAEPVMSRTHNGDGPTRSYVQIESDEPQDAVDDQRGTELPHAEPLGLPDRPNRVKVIVPKQLRRPVRASTLASDTTHRAKQTVTGPRHDETRSGDRGLQPAFSSISLWAGGRPPTPHPAS